MIVIVVMVAFVAGMIGGVLGAAFLEAYFQRREDNRIGENDEVE